MIFYALSRYLKYSFHFKHIKDLPIIKLSCKRAQSLQSCPTLSNPMNYRPPDSSVHGILLARMLEWVAMSSSRVSSQPRDQICVFCIAGRFLTAELPGKSIKLSYIHFIIDHPVRWKGWRWWLQWPMEQEFEISKIGLFALLIFFLLIIVPLNGNKSQTYLLH